MYGGLWAYMCTCVLTVDIFQCLHFDAIVNFLREMDKFVVLRIRDGSKTIKEWCGIPVPRSSTLADVFADFSSGKNDGEKSLDPKYDTVVVRVGKSKSDSFTKVQSNSVIDDVTSLLGLYVDFAVSHLEEQPEPDEVNETVTKNVFDLMMATQREKNHLPPHVDETDRKKKVYNMVVDLLKSHSL